MPLHLKKLCVGVETIDQLQASIIRRNQGAHLLTGRPYIYITTRNRPRRDMEEASLYWIINRVLCCRQKIVQFREGTRENGTPCIHIDLDHELHLVRNRPHRPFQGWRYLEDKDAPYDLAASSGGSDDDTLPAAMQRELAKLGLL